jgi:Fe-S-cluster containining protein
MATSCPPGCGSCCDPVVLPFTKFDMAANPAFSAEDRRWVLDDLQPMARREAYAKRPDLRDRAMVDQRGRPATPVFFRCRHFDPESRACTAYEARPPVCRGFPWYDRPPSEHALLPPACAFRDELVQLGPTRR